MNQNTKQILEFNYILKKLSDHALSQDAKEKLLSLSPYMSEKECKQKIKDTTSAVEIINASGNPPLASMKDLSELITLVEKGAMLIPEQLTAVAAFINDCKRCKKYLQSSSVQNNLCAYAGSLDDQSALYELIETTIIKGIVSDNASTTLRDIRRRIENSKMAVKEKLETILRSRKECFSEGFVAIRNGRQVLPVKKEYKNQIVGVVVDISGSGGTYFIEPASVGKIHSQLAELQIDEDNEIRKILYTLTAQVYEAIPKLKINMQCMEVLDFIFAKGKLSIELEAVEAKITTERRINIINGKHPLIDKSVAVPLNFSIGGDTKGVIITGPNTGGKTVSLKTVGLLSLMVQCGLHVPVAEGSIFAMHSNILCDIGDGQNISQNLSTFSSHITNIIDILKNTTCESLVLLDEVGSGTDPAEGMGIAVAILEELRKKDCLFLATTHYPEIKEYATKTQGLMNARMEFDRESLKPLYKLEQGEAGESCALYIARRLGFPEHMLKTAYDTAYKTEISKTKQAPQISFAQEVVADNTTAYLVIKKDKPTAEKKYPVFSMGDSVEILPNGEIAIVYTSCNDKGDVIVQIKGEKTKINYKRIVLKTPASELYPPDYDFSIIFDSVENRKARHKMTKGHRPDLEIKY